MNTVDDYFSSLNRFLQKHKSIAGLEPEAPYQRITDQFGLMTFTLRQERIRIISARKANKHERKIYQDQIASQQN